MAIHNYNPTAVNSTSPSIEQVVEVAGVDFILYAKGDAYCLRDTTSGKKHSFPSPVKRWQFIEVVRAIQEGKVAA